METVEESTDDDMSDTEDSLMLPAGKLLLVKLYFSLMMWIYLQKIQKPVWTIVHFSVLME